MHAVRTFVTLLVILSHCVYYVNELCSEKSFEVPGLLCFCYDCLIDVSLVHIMLCPLEHG
jgi:hypothetical protein